MEGDLLARLVVVALAVVVVVVVARRRPAHPAAPLATQANLEGPGVFLFTSSACDSCAAAQAVYEKVLGPDGFTELTWENDAALLSRLGVEEIPVATVIDGDGVEVASFRLIPTTRSLRRAVERAFEG